MPRHAPYTPHGVIPAVLLPFADDLSIDEQSFRKHLADIAATEGLSAITVNAHSTEVASCSFDEQRRVLEIAQDEVGGQLPIVNGIWADGSLEAARITPSILRNSAALVWIRFQCRAICGAISRSTSSKASSLWAPARRWNTLSMRLRVRPLSSSAAMVLAKLAGIGSAAMAAISATCSASAWA